MGFAYPFRLGAGLVIAALWCWATPAGAQPQPPRANPQAAEASPPGDRIVATVNADVITTGDVDNRARLFALSTGMRLSSDVVARLRPQIMRQLIDERLRMQEAMRRKVVVPDQTIANAIREIEQRNNMPAGMLRARLSVDGVGQRTLVSQLRAQLAWTQVLREALGERSAITEEDVEAQARLFEQLTGRTEFRVGEIFIPIDDPNNTAEAQRFAETVIGELRLGAAFQIVAAQFSQAQGALEGGDRGWVQLSQLDPAVADLVTQMPPGAISNPVKVPGGFAIVTLFGKRDIGRELATALTMRQAFLPFATPLNPQAPTEAQRQVLERARGLAARVQSCEQMEAAARDANPGRPVDPGEVRLEGVEPPAFRQLLATQPLGKSTEPLVSPEGILLISICARERKEMSSMSKQDIQRFLMNERVELLSRQMLRDLRRKAIVQIRA
jgi:peptidyl-prolyl cis-trans isomerase SurA